MKLKRLHIILLILLKRITYIFIDIVIVILVITMGGLALFSETFFSELTNILNKNREL